MKSSVGLENRKNKMFCGTGALRDAVKKIDEGNMSLREGRQKNLFLLWTKGRPPQPVRGHVRN